MDITETSMGEEQHQEDLQETTELIDEHPDQHRPDRDRGLPEGDPDSVLLGRPVLDQGGHQRVPAIAAAACSAVAERRSNLLVTKGELRSARDMAHASLSDS